MKSSLFTNWVTYFYVAVMFFFNLNPAFAGGDVPKFRAKEVPRAKPVLFPNLRKKIEEAKQERQARPELKTPHMDDLAKNPVTSRNSQRYPCCRPSCKPSLIRTFVPPPPPLITTFVPPPPPLLVTTVPPPPDNPLIETNVPPPPPLLDTFVPVREHLALIETRLSYREEFLIDAGPVPEPLVIVNYIQLPCPPVIDWCPPDPCPPEIYVEERRHQVKRRHHVEHREMFVQEPPCFQERFVQEPPCFDQFNGRHGGFVGNHQGFNPGWQNGGHPGVHNGGQHYGHGSGDPLGYDTGHRIVNNAYNTGYDANARNFEIGRNIGLWNYDAAMNRWRG